MWELTIYPDGSAILTDEDGNEQWSSDDDDELSEDGFPDVLTGEDGDALAEYLEDAGYLPEGEELDIVESDFTGKREVLAEGDDDDEDDEE